MPYREQKDLDASLDRFCRKHDCTIKKGHSYGYYGTDGGFDRTEYSKQWRISYRDYPVVEVVAHTHLSALINPDYIHATYKISATHILWSLPHEYDAHLWLCKNGDTLINTIKKNSKGRIQHLNCLSFQN